MGMVVVAVAVALAPACSGSRGSATSPSPIGGGGSQVPPVAACDASRVEWAVGERASDALLERARVEAAAQTARFIRRGQPLTMEFIGSRLNLEIDEHDTVLTVRCG
ncbi:MAG: I78 family peptidase inhibitor [Vicinamibacteria bacterium]